MNFSDPFPVVLQTPVAKRMAFCNVAGNENKVNFPCSCMCEQLSAGKKWAMLLLRQQEGLGKLRVNGGREAQTKQYLRPAPVMSVLNRGVSQYGPAGTPGTINNISAYRWSNICTDAYLPARKA